MQAVVERAVAEGVAPPRSRMGCFEHWVAQALTIMRSAGFAEFAVTPSGFA